MRSLALAFCLLAAALVAGEARADSAGEPGRLVAIEVNTPDSDVYAIRRGRLYVEETATKTRRPYLFGDSSLCPNFEVSELQIDMLARAATNPRILIKPFYKTGNGGSRCLVAFVFGTVKDVADIVQ
jgi:hypothetical protein